MDSCDNLTAQLLLWRYWFDKMFALQPYDTVHEIFKYLDLQCFTNLRLVDRATKVISDDLGIKRYRNFVFICRWWSCSFCRFLNDREVRVYFDYYVFHVLATKYGDDNDDLISLGSFRCEILRPYRDWFTATGEFNFRHKWRLFAALFGSTEDGKHYVTF